MAHLVPTAGLRAICSPGEVSWKGGVAGSILALLYVYPLPALPHYGLCVFHWLTGSPCPFCGLTRSLSFLAHGRWDLAVSFHPLGPLVFGLLLALLFGNLLRLGLPGLRSTRIHESVNRIFWAACSISFGICGVLRWCSF
jgi:Protein of unknown function (DUF2752)